MENIHKNGFIVTNTNDFQNDILFSVRKFDEQLEGKLLYNSNLFNQDTIQRLWDGYQRVMAQVLTDLDITIASVYINSVEERETVLYSFNQNSQLTMDKTISSLFEEQVEKVPENTAVICGNDSITYRALNGWSNQLARVLRQKNIGPDCIVSIIIKPSLELVVAIMGTLKTGGAYLPIEVNDPPERIKYLIANSNTRIIITAEPYLSPADGLEYSTVDIIKIDSFETHHNQDNDHSFPYHGPNHLAYIIYTSGTTGKPKGVCVEQRGIVNYTTWRIRTYSYTYDDVTLQPLSPGFDGFGSNFYSSILSGSALVIVEDSLKLDYSHIKNLIKKHNVTNISLVPDMYRVLLESAKNEDLGTLRFVVLAGDKYNSHLINLSKIKAPHALLINEYGLTETSVTAIAYFPINSSTASIIGRPIANTYVYIMDALLRPAPIKVVGEICISGIGVARGYLNDQELTKERFTPIGNILRNLDHSYSILFKTGDMARWLPNGLIEFLGRKDMQVKIRGHRIELEEIRTLLIAHKHINEAIVTLKPPNQTIYAYFIANNPISVSQLKIYLAEKLPDYMIPSYFILLENIPLTPNGKVDYNALPILEENSPEAKYIGPRNPIEKKLADIWANVLETEKSTISIDSNFFKIGGHSLKVTLVISRIHKEFNVKIPLVEFFNIPTIREIYDYIVKAEEDKYVSIKPSEKKEYYPLSSAQKRLYFIHRMNKTSTAYNISQVVTSQGDPDLEKLENTFRNMILRHESLRTSFRIVNETPVQYVYHEVPFNIEYQSFEYDTNIETIMRNFIKPFDLTRAPLFRVGLIQIKGKYYLLIDMHHIISDGISQGILSEDFMAFMSGRQLPQLPLQYKDYSLWQLQNIDKKEGIYIQEIYWKNQFDGEIPILDLPIDYPRPAVQSYEGKRLNLLLSSSLSQSLKSLAFEQSATLFIVLLTAYYILLSKISSQEDIVIGTPVAGRRHPDLQKIIGIFINTLALRNYPRHEKIISNFLTEVKNRSFEAFENQEYPFEELVEQLSLFRDASRNPLFDVLFVYHEKASHNHEIASNQPVFESQAVKFDITLYAEETDQGLLLGFQYSTKLFKENTIQRISAYFEKLLINISASHSKRISEIEFIPGEEKQKLLIELNCTDMPYPKDKKVAQLFEGQEQRTPYGIAVVDSETSITYCHINQTANRLARILCNKGVIPNSIVAIPAIPNSLLIISVVAILKAGGAYLPVNMEYPPERINFMLKDSQALFIISNEESNAHNNTFQLRLNDKSLYAQDSTNLKKVGAATDFAYLIYTSGTTGKPKGVLLSHQNLVNYVTWFSREIRFNTDEKTMLTSSFAFDLGYSSVYPSLLSGGSLHMIGRDVNLSPLNLIRNINKWKISYLKMTPSLFKTIVNSSLFGVEPLKHLRLVVLGGEAVIPEDIEKLHIHYENVKVINHYGPTETTIGCVARFIDLSPGGFFSYRKNPTIGRPIANTHIYIMDKHFNVLPIGIPGELCIAGVCLGWGYLNRPELTAEKFVSLYSKNHEIKTVYRTGDRARWLLDGNIEFLGRIDNQVKIRGYRIEPGEIENRILSHPSVKDTVVLIREDDGGSKYLCAYVIMKNEIDQTSFSHDLKMYLEMELPPYMIPAHIVILDKIPLNHNLKIDRKALPDPTIRTYENEPYMAPTDEIEEKLVEICQEIFNVKKIGVEDNFFNLGVHSLDLIMLISRIHKEMGIELQVTQLYNKPVIKEIAKQLKLSRQYEQDIIIFNHQATRKIFIFPPGIGYGLVYSDLGAKLKDYAIYAFNFIEDADRVTKYAHMITTFQPTGDYILMAYSGSGGLAFQVVNQLEKQKKKILGIILADSFWSEGHGGIIDAQREEFIQKVQRQLVTWNFEFLKEKVAQKMRTYMQYNLNLNKLPIINSDVHLILSEETQNLNINPRWDEFTNGSMTCYNGFGVHHEIFTTSLEKNIPIIRKILTYLEKS
ncbi:MAG: amino acid adenylation domain-containing protein [Acidobacteria bacterium]|nr:amino acid adenylation domain-containing protein [Acidobacteriota bacterium]